MVRVAMHALAGPRARRAAPSVPPPAVQPADVRRGRVQSDLRADHTDTRRQHSDRAHKARHVRPPPRSASPRLAWTIAAVSGFAALVYEVAWTRLLAMIIGPTTYAFATMAAAFIVGLAIGSTLGARIAH